MRKGKVLAVLLAAIPFLTLVFALPLVNRIKPVVFGLPFIIFWILLWILLTPAILYAAFRAEDNGNPPGKDKRS